MITWIAGMEMATREFSGNGDLEEIMGTGWEWGKPWE